MKYRLLVVPIIAVVLSACDSVSERECGVFDHPELALWQSDNNGAQALFMSEDGTTVNFDVMPVVLNEPFLGSDGSSNDEDVICDLTATVRLQSTDGTVAIDSLYIQRERLLLPSADESLFIDHSTEVPVGTVLPGNFLADISVALPRINFAPSRIVYLEADDTTEETGSEDTDTEDTDTEVLLTQEIGGQTYEDVVRVDAANLITDQPDTETGAIRQITQIAVARDFGIVAFTDDLEREFVRVPTL